MPGPSLEILQRFRTAEIEHDYTKLIDLFSDDAVYVDPLFGTVRGRAAILEFYERMEALVPGHRAKFLNWHIAGDTNCGWAEWDMVAPNAVDKLVTVPGQTLYRLRNGKVTYFAAYLDAHAFEWLRGGEHIPLPDHSVSLGLSASSDHPRGVGHDLLVRFWQAVSEGRYPDLTSLFGADAQYRSPIEGTFTGIDEITGFMTLIGKRLPSMNATNEIVDLAGDDTVGWAQWWLRLPNGAVPCWSVFTFRAGRITLAHSFMDTVVLRRLTQR